MEQVDSYDPTHYGRTRNHLDGAVSRLSPYISRGVISCRAVMEKKLQQGHSFEKIEKFIQELAWRDYWQQIWINKGAAIDSDLKREQQAVLHHGIPKAIVEGTTGIHAVDKEIQHFYESGYMHNHLRMYVAAISCNLAYCHWKKPAQWMYYHLLDGDWASNALSWQWVAGSNANKKYVANQNNIDKYCAADQAGSWLDIPYEQFEGFEAPAHMHEMANLNLKSTLPESSELTLNPALPTYVYNWYNLDFQWDSEVEADRVLLIEPSIFQRYPISDRSMRFMLDLSKNIDDIQIIVSEFEELEANDGCGVIHFKEHPLNANYQGVEHQREWMSSVEGYFPSFFSFWKKCRKELPK